MEKEQHNFVYGNEEEGVKGCIANGISEEIAVKIYNDMMDFAKYAFNKSHAAAYAVVSYQTAYLKYYYPVEFMAALMTSVIDNTAKVSEYIMASRNLGIRILPPDINEGESGFSVSENAIRYGLSALKSVGHTVIDIVVREREANGKFKNLTDFATRLSGREVNKRTVESFIKAGAFDSLEGNRRQLMQVYNSVLDQVNEDKKKSITGQMSLFDLVPEEEKSAYEISLPNVEEYSREELLAFEKEVLGIYVSGHPLEEYEEKWSKNITAQTRDFVPDEEGKTTVADNEPVIIGGMITNITIKPTKTGKTMAFLTLEDLVGTIEVIVFPNIFERQRYMIQNDAKVFIKGKVSLGDDEQGKVICDRIIEFSKVPRELWIQFQDKEAYLDKEKELFSLLEESDGNDTVIIYCKTEKAKKILPERWRIHADKALVKRIGLEFGENNVKVVEKNIENN